MGANRVFTIFGSSEVAHTTLTHACPNSELNPQPNGHLCDSWDHFINPLLLWNNFHTLWLIKAPVVRRPRMLIPGSWLCHTANYLVCPIGLVLYWQTYEIWTAPHMPVLVWHRCVIPGLLQSQYMKLISRILDVPQWRCHGVVCAVIPDMADVWHPLCYVMGKPVNALTQSKYAPVPNEGYSLRVCNDSLDQNIRCAKAFRMMSQASDQEFGCGCPISYL